MATASIFDNDANSPTSFITTSWQNARRTNLVGGESLGKRSDFQTRQDSYLSLSGDESSSDGFLRRVERRNNNLPDLKNVNNSRKLGDNDNYGVQSKTFPGVSLLAGKYLLFPEAPLVGSMPRRAGSPPKAEMTCLNIQTKGQFSCKVVQRNPAGLSMLAAYYRLDDSTDFVSQVTEAILTPKVLYLIMPKHYGNVHSYLLERRTLEEAEAANLFKQMVEIVQHCHSKGVILRDIKMGKFVFVDKSKTKVKLESLEDSWILVDPCNDQLDDKHGCPNYVSPEKAETLQTKLRYPGKASDVWCLGVILYTMLTGRYPFNDQNQSKLLHKIRVGNFAIPPGLSSSVSFLIKTLLLKSPAERPRCNEILKSPWLTKHCVSTPSMLIIETKPLRKESRVDNKTQTPPPQPTVCMQLEPSDQVVPDF